MRQSIQNNVRQRIAANRQRAEQERQREEREREAIRSLNRKQQKEQSK